MDYARISCKNLGLLKLKNFCELCFWLQMVLWHNKAPFRFNPARLITRLDPFQKRMILDYWTENEGVFPDWLGPFAEAIDCEGGGRLTYECQETGLTMTGVPDLIFEFVDDIFGILDEKTAMFSVGDDPLMPMYEVQLNAYAYCLEAQGKNVGRAGFAYFEGDTGQLGAVPHKLVTDVGHDFNFFVFFKEIDLNPEKMIPPLLKKVRAIYELEEPPEPSAECPHCQMLQQYLNLMRGKKKTLKDSLRQNARPDRVLLVPDRLGVLDLWDPEE